MTAGAWLTPGVVYRQLNFTNSSITRENIVVALLTALVVLWLKILLWQMWQWLILWVWGIVSLLL